MRISIPPAEKSLHFHPLIFFQIASFILRNKSTRCRPEQLSCLFGAFSQVARNMNTRIQTNAEFHSEVQDILGRYETSLEQGSETIFVWMSRLNNRNHYRRLLGLLA
ncbi:hypothetical protein ACOSP7_021495 [Xanthoceras sorbifolium]